MEASFKVKVFSLSKDLIKITAKKLPLFFYLAGVIQAEGDKQDLSIV